MASFASSATTGGACKHAWTKKLDHHHLANMIQMPAWNLTNSISGRHGNCDGYCTFNMDWCRWPSCIANTVG